MLSSLQIKNYVLIDSLDVGFPEGLLIITGQTGAGKSILLGALNLALGAKADASVVSEGAESCVVEAVFTSPDPAMREMVEDAGAEWDASEMTIRRVVARSGRSRSFVNDCPVNVLLLGSMAGYLVDVHSQHQSLRLSDPAFQMASLDSYAGNAELLGKLSASWKKIRSLTKELDAEKEKKESLSEREEYIRARFDTLDKADLRDGELAELELEQRQLANAEQIKTSLNQALCLFDSGEGPGMSASLKEAQKLLEKISRFVPSLSELASRLESSRLELDDVFSEIEDVESSVNLSEERLAAVEERMALVYDLFSRFGCRTEAELIEKKEEYSKELFDSSEIEERIEALEKTLETAKAEYDSLCGEIRGRRQKAAPLFSAEIEKSLRFLELDRAVFSVEVSPREAGPDGADGAAFLFSSNGTRPENVSKCASGGEISRIMLCLKALMARFTGMPTMVFDEIDTGVSGSAADKMGQMICSMGKDMQVFAITHLPQVASKADAHYLVSKESGKTSVTLLDERGRLEEIARLLSGSTVTPEALANAASLLRER